MDNIEMDIFRRLEQIDPTIDAVRSIVDGNNIFLRDVNGNTILHHLIINFPVHEDVVQLLIDLGTQINAVNNLGETALHLASITNPAHVVLTTTSIDLFDNPHYTPWPREEYRKECDLGVVRILLKAGAKVSKKTKSGAQALHIAACFGNPELIKLLLEYDARVNILDSGHKSPLDLAYATGNWVVVKLLLCAGALVFSDHPMRKYYPQNLFPLDHLTPLYIAVQIYDSVSSEENLQHVQTLLKFALLERPLLHFVESETFHAKEETFNLLNEMKSVYLHELQLMVCFEPDTTLAQFILRMRLREEDEYQNDQILEVLSSDMFPNYNEVIFAALLTSQDLKDGLQQHLMYMESDDPDPSKRVRLNFDSLWGVIAYLSDEDLLHLLLASYKRKNSPSPIGSMPNNVSLQEISLASERYFKRARFI